MTSATALRQNTATQMLFLDFQPVQISHLTARRKSAQSHLKSCRSPERLSTSSRSRRSSSGECTKKDTVLSQVVNSVRNGWPISGPECKMGALKPFFNAHMEICEVNGVLLRDCRVIVPQELQSKVITMLHQSHRGIVRMKTMARLYVWWPNIETSIETCCKACNICAVTATAPAANLSPWPITDNPWDRVHVDFAGPFLGSMWLLAMDAHSKWPSVIRLANYPTTEVTIAGLDALFTSWGIPKTLVSDNGPQFASADVANWCRSNGIVHMTSAPFLPSSNGAAERLV